MTKDIVKLRPHHLGLCLQTYSGAGYTPEFVANMTAVAERLNSGAAVQIVRGPDEICQPMLQNGEQFHCFDGDVKLRDTLALQGMAMALGYEVNFGQTYQFGQTDWSNLRTAFRDGISRQGCADCSWKERCDASAAGGFQRAKLRCGL